MKFHLFILIVFLPATLFASAKPSKYEIRWRINHTPKSYFKQAVEVFKKEVRQRTSGEVTVVANFVAVDSGTSRELLSQVQSGDVEMAQVYTSDIALKNPAFNVFDLPYLFRDHQHAKRVFESKVGTNLLGQLEKIDVVGLGYTYSGGYVVRIGKKTISRLEDLQGASMRLFNGTWAARAMQNLGVQVVTSGKPNYLSATYADLVNVFDFKKMNTKDHVFSETKDRLLVTTLVMNSKFFERLPERHQRAVREAAVIAARSERQNIIDSGQRIRDQVEKRGFRQVSLSEAQRNRWEHQSQKIYSRFAEEYPKGASLVKKIRNEANHQRVAGK